MDRADGSAGEEDDLIPSVGSNAVFVETATPGIYALREAKVVTFAMVVWHFWSDHTLWEIDAAYRKLRGRMSMTLLP